MSANYWIGATSTAYATAGNWGTGGAAATGDDVTFDGRGNTNSLAGSNQSAITLGSLTQYTSFTQDIGTAGTMLQIGATSVSLGVAAQDGSSKTPGEIAINFGAAQTEVTVYSSAKQGTNQLPPILLKGAHASNVLNVISGIVGWAADIPGATGTLLKANIIGSGANLLVESGTTLTTVNQDNGKGLIKCAFTTLNQIGGTLEIRGASAVTTANVGGTTNFTGTGTITTLNVNDNGLADFGGSFDAITVTDANVYGSGVIRDPNKRVAWTNPILTKAGANSSQIQIGNGVTIKPA